MTAFQIEVKAGERIAEFEHTALATMFSHSWRIVSLDTMIAGYSPFPDGSVVLTMHAAGEVLRALQAYLLKDKDRMGPIPASKLYPKFGRVNVDWFELSTTTGMCAMVNWLVYSAGEISEAVKQRYMDPGTSLAQWWQVVRLYGCVGQDPADADWVVWPARYWQFRTSRVHKIRGLTRAGEHGDPSPLSDFIASAMVGNNRGTIPDFTPAIVRPTTEERMVHEARARAAAG
jgi:hypothetical protein